MARKPVKPSTNFQKLDLDSLDQIVGGAAAAMFLTRPSRCPDRPEMKDE